MNLYTAALTARRDSSLAITSRLLYGSNEEDAQEAAMELCRATWTWAEDYHGHEVALTEYNLLLTLKQLSTVIAKGSLPAESDDALTLATICDMVLGEDAEDRSNAALVQAVGRLLKANK